jgi:outer membrane protein TolC
MPLLAMERFVCRGMSLAATSVFLAVLFIFFAYMTIAASNLSPPSPEKAWYPEGLNKYEAELANGHMESEGRQVTVDPDKVYDLPALIDIAERANPQTRIAWERARQAAEAVGLSQSAYFPFLVASASAGYEQAFIPVPTLKVGPGPREVSVTGGGNLTTDVALEDAVIDMKWLLFDFGERKAVTTIAKEQLIMANVGFSAVHQQLVFVVTAIAVPIFEGFARSKKLRIAESELKEAENELDGSRDTVIQSLNNWSFCSAT